MATTGIVRDVFYTRHDTGPGHPESSRRLDSIYAELDRREIMDQAQSIDKREALPEELMRVHTREHVQLVASTAARTAAYLDGDTPTSPDSFKAALLAAGGLMNATDAVIQGDVKNAFALVRPPGHHAESSQAMGFCLFNNVAVAAMHAIEKRGKKRILIIDWDVHHGNATMHSFYKDPRVMYFSTHHYPFYPGTGRWDEIGDGEGKGYTVNVPFPGGCGDGEHDNAFSRIFDPVVKAYKPDLIMVSAGFDAHYRDPLGGMRVTEEGFQRMTRRVLEWADEFSDGQVVMTLEGGYNLEALANSVADVIEVCMGKKQAPGGDLDSTDGFEAVRPKVAGALSGIWKGLD